MLVLTKFEDLKGKMNKEFYNPLTKYNQSLNFAKLIVT